MTDPRLHRHVASVDGDRIRYKCGCANEIARPSGILHSVAKCDDHRRRARDPATLDEAYYRQLGALDADAPSRYVGELAEALGPFEPNPCPYALEVGCGASPYRDAIRSAGYAYTGVDPSRWAAERMLDHLGAGVLCGDFERMLIDSEFGLILAAHCLEHMVDAPGAVRKCADLLAPGGELWVIVPDDEDPVNPDHLWFYDSDTLRACVESAGLVVDRLEVRKYVPQENFLYLRARKPA